MRFLKFLYTLPVLPILIGYELHVIFMIVKETDHDELMNIEAKKELKYHTAPHLESFRKKYAGPLHLFSILSWITFIKIVILHS
jgi:hypothetical protein